MAVLNTRNAKKLKRSDLGVLLSRMVPVSDADMYMFMYPKYMVLHDNLFTIPMQRKEETVIRIHNMKCVIDSEFNDIRLNVFKRESEEIGYVVVKNLKKNEIYIYRC